MIKTSAPNFVSTRNACKLCTPLGASFVFKGIKNCMPLLHGSQGCSTYIRRYMISHFKEPIDIASSNFTESSAIFGGKDNLHTAIENIIKQYDPEILGIASTCLSETIGDDVSMFIHEFKSVFKDYNLPEIVNVSTPSYQGTHAEGFWKTVLAMVRQLSVKGTADHINLFPGMFSPADLRFLKEVMNDFEIPFVMLPDYSETLDGNSWQEYKKIPTGGTTIDEIKSTGLARASIELGNLMHTDSSPAKWLEGNNGIGFDSMMMPIGVNATDKFFSVLKKLSGKKTPQKHILERGRLVDAYADGHKYVFGKKAVVYGEPDLVISLVSFLDEIGIEPVLCATGSSTQGFEKAVRGVMRNPSSELLVLEDVDFEHIGTLCREIKPDMMMGHSKGYYICRELGIPLVRVGFPVHDRIGGQRILHIGYQGAMQLFDKVANALIEYKQENSEVGYKYM